MFKYNILLSVALLTLAFIPSCKSSSPVEAVQDSQAEVCSPSELTARYALFPTLSQADIAARNSQLLLSYSALNQLSVISGLYNAIKAAPTGAQLIPVDFRYYGVDGHHTLNFIISNFPDDLSLNVFLSKSSEYTQGFFSVVNFGKTKVTFVPTQQNPTFTRMSLPRADLYQSEVVLNFSNIVNYSPQTGAENLFLNLKLSGTMKSSLIADNLDNNSFVYVMYASKTQDVLSNNWVMPVASFANSNPNVFEFKHGNVGYFNNQNFNPAHDTSNKTNSVSCYSSQSGHKIPAKI